MRSQVEMCTVLQHPVTGVATTPEGLVFILHARVNGSTGATFAEWHKGGQPPALLNTQWNSYAAVGDPSVHLIRDQVQCTCVKALLQLSLTIRVTE